MEAVLPTKLEYEPIVDCAFQINFETYDNVPAIPSLPGLFIAAFTQEGIALRNIQNYPVSNIPQDVRLNDSNLRYQPLHRLEFDNCSILLGDSMLAIGGIVNHKYRGWTNYEQDIQNVLSKAMKFHIIKSITRHSLKYVNIIEGTNIEECKSKLNLQIDTGHSQPYYNFSLSTEQTIENVNILMNFQGYGSAKFSDGTIKNGLLFDIDTLSPEYEMAFNEFETQFLAEIKKLKKINREFFFQTLTAQTLAEYGATYE